ncbi:MAG: hypothetical protein P8K77_05330 [Polaribacter sp.]|nr:hypothetical protein [Polaribacter sp.]
MLPQLLTYGKSFAAVEHTVGADAKEIISFLQLKKKQKELVIESKGQVASFEKLLPAIQAQKHLFLVINNQQVLLKKVDAIDENQEHLVKIAFPSIKLSDFYYEVLSCKEHSFVTICRKAYVDDLIAHYESEGISVVAISFHNFAIQQLATFIEQEEIHTSNSLISLQKNSIVNIQNQATEKIVYNINDLQITNDELLPLAGIIDYYSGTQKEQLGLESCKSNCNKNSITIAFLTLD